MKTSYARLGPVLCLALVLLVPGAPCAQPQGGKLARQTFADLLKVPLAPPVVSVTVNRSTDEDGLLVEDLAWESLDGERVPAFVIRPKDAHGRLPAIICLHGSTGSRDSMVTKSFGLGSWVRPGAREPHTRMLGWARELSRRGFLTLALTQRGLDTRTPAINVQANELLIHGRTAMGAVLYEIRQALTYLQQRPDVDPDAVGATGMSFGGITAFYTFLIDERLAAAASICGGVGSLEVFSRLGSISYHGTYWWVPDMLLKGDQADFVAALPVRPLMLWAPTEDIGMPKEGVQQFVRLVKPVYEAAGKSSMFVVHNPPGEHSFTPEAFEAMERFFKEHLRPGS